MVSRETFKRIFQEHWEGFQEENPRYAGNYYDGVIGKMLGCGDPTNGFMAYRCLHCGELKRVPFSCKSSFCLSCAKVYTEQWVEYINKALFRGMKYRHVVLTMPEELRKWFREDDRLLGQLMVRMLKEEVEASEMAEAVDRCWRKYPRGFVSYIEKGEVPEGGKGLAYYLAKYVVSPPISLKRIISYDGHKVKYWYNDHTTGRRVEEEVDAKVFIARMVQHILPKGFQRVRYYGLQATCRASKVRDKLLALMKSREERIRDTYTVTGNGYRNRVKESFGVDPLICGRCGQEMEFEGVWHPKYGWIIDNWKSFFMEENLVTGYG